MDEENVTSGTPADVTNSPAEKALSKEQIVELVKHEKAKAAESVRRELEAAHKAEIDKIRLGQTQQLGGMKDTSALDDDMAQRVYKQAYSKLEQEMQTRQEQMAKEQHEAEMRRIADNYFSKLRSGKERYNDFDEIVGDFKHDAFPELVYHLSGMENAADIMYELNKNPEKLERIDYWLNKDRRKGLDMLNKLSQSILQVRAAEEDYQPVNAPLSQVKPSNVGADNGRMSLEDYKNADWLRF